MNYRRFFLLFVFILLGGMALAEPIRLMAQTAEPVPVVTEPVLLPTPTPTPVTSGTPVPGADPGNSSIPASM